MPIHAACASVADVSPSPSPPPSPPSGRRPRTPTSTSPSPWAPAAVGGLGVHTYDANGQLVAGAPTATGASGLYLLPTSAITGAALPLQVRVDPIVDQCTGQTLAPVASVVADFTNVMLTSTPAPTMLCADPAPTAPRDRLMIGAYGAVTGTSGGSIDVIMLTPPSDDGVIELIDMNFAVLGTVAATPGSLYTRFRLTAPATAVQTMFGMRWKFAGSSLMAPIGTMAVQPEQPVQDPLRPGAVDVFAVVDVSETAAAADPGGIRRADAMRLLPLLLGPTGGYVASVAIAGDLNPLTVPSPPSTGLLARGRPGAFNYDGAFSYSGAAFASSPEPYRPKVVFVLTASDVPGTYAGGHLSLTHTIAGHRWPVVALPFGPSPLLVPSLGPIAGETGGIVQPSASAAALPGAVLEAWARLHGGRRSQTTPLSATGRKAARTVVRGQAGKALRVVVTWDVKPLALTMTTPAGKPVQFRPFGRGAVAEVPRAKAGAYRVVARPAKVVKPSAAVKGTLVATIG